LPYPFEKYNFIRVEFLAKPGHPIRCSVEEKGRFVPVDENRWISDHTSSAQTRLLYDAGAGSEHDH